MKIKLFMSVLICFLNMSLAFSSPLIYSGTRPVLKSIKIDTQNEYNNKQEISIILNAESHVRTVGEAIDLKTSGLIYVQNISDFEYLTTTPFRSPTIDYINAVGDFIAQNISHYFYSPYDIQILRVLEARVPNIGQAMQVKNAALRVRLQIQDFLRLIPPAITNPSDAYLTAISNFTATNISQILDFYSPIYLIVEAEKYTRTVGDAMSVKNAGLVAVRNQFDLYELARFAVANPSAAYQQAVNDFLRANLYRYPRY